MANANVVVAFWAKNYDCDCDCVFDYRYVYDDEFLLATDCDSCFVLDSDSDCDFSLGP